MVDKRPFWSEQWRHCRRMNGSDTAGRSMACLVAGASPSCESDTSTARWNPPRRYDTLLTEVWHDSMYIHIIIIIDKDPTLHTTTCDMVQLKCTKKPTAHGLLECWCNGLVTQWPRVWLLALHFQVTPLPTAKLFTRQLAVPVMRRWCPAAGKVTVGLVLQRPCITDFSVHHSMGSQPTKGR